MSAHVHSNIGGMSAHVHSNIAAVSAHVHSNVKAVGTSVHSNIAGVSALSHSNIAFLSANVHSNILHLICFSFLPRVINLWVELGSTVLFLTVLYFFDSRLLLLVPVVILKSDRFI
jgi:hypothetical protein